MRGRTLLQCITPRGRPRHEEDAVQNQHLTETSVHLACSIRHNISSQCLPQYEACSPFKAWEETSLIISVTAWEETIPDLSGGWQGVQALGSVKRLNTIVLFWRYINKIEFNGITGTTCDAFKFVVKVTLREYTDKMYNFLTQWFVFHWQMIPSTKNR